MTVTDLRELIDRHARGRGLPTAVPRQTLVRQDAPAARVDLEYPPMLCFVALGAKEAVVGERTVTVSAGEVFFSAVRVPVLATFSTPYRSASLVIDDQQLAEAAVAAGPASRSDRVEGMITAPMSAGLTAAVTRWVGLLDEPELIPVLAPRIEQEILSRVLLGPLGSALRAAVLHGPLRRVRDAAGYLVEHAHESIAVADLAKRSGLSESVFYRDFRAATGTTPSQFQKSVRLQRARGLLAAGTHTAEAAAHAVGYRSATQFNRDYRRRYGDPPARDGRSLRTGGDAARAERGE